MNLKENKNDLEIEDVSKTDTNFRSLYGLTLEVENALDRHANILESCVCGIDDPKFGEIVGAYIYCNADVSEEAIKEFLNESIAGYKVPEVLHISKDPLPRIATEKIDRVGIKKILSSQ